MSTPDEKEEFDRDAYQRGLEGDEDILFPSESNQEGIKEYDKRQAEKADNDDDQKDSAEEEDE